MSSYSTDTECEYCDFDLAISGSEGNNEYIWCPCCGYSFYELDDEEIMDSYKIRMAEKLGIDEKDVDYDDIDDGVWDESADDIRDDNGFHKIFEPSGPTLEVAKLIAKSTHENIELLELVDGELGDIFQKTSQTGDYKDLETLENKKDMAEIFKNIENCNNSESEVKRLLIRILV
jgi:hypothetical protein